MVETVKVRIDIETKDKTKAGTNSVVNSLKKIRKESDETQRSLLKWAKEKYQCVVDMKDKVGPTLKTLQGNLKGFAGKAWNVAVGIVDKVTAPLRGIMNMLTSPLFAAGTVLGVSFTVSDSINAFKDFEATMSKVSAISGATGSDLDALTQKAKELGAQTKFTSTEVGEAFNFMGMAGWKTEEMLAGIEGILNLSAAAGEEIGTVSDIVTDALTAFGLGADASNHFADVLAAASSNANTNVTMMGESFKYAAAAAGAMNYSVEDVSEVLSLMANSGIKSSMAGTALRSIITRLSTDAGASSKSLGALGVLTQKLGVEFYDSAGNARDFSDVIDEARIAWRGLNDEEAADFGKKIAGQQALSGWLALMNATEKDLSKIKLAIEDCDGAAERMAETMMDNLQGSLTKLQSALDNVKIGLGERLAPYVREFADWLTSKMPDISAAIDKAMDKFDETVDKVRQKWSELTSSEDWQNADFFGKVKLAWDELIANPFSEWWNSTGKAFFAEKAGEIGNAIGSGIAIGVATLLGLDIDGAWNDGVSIGAAFASGLLNGLALLGGQGTANNISNQMAGAVGLTSNTGSATSNGAALGGFALKIAGQIGNNALKVLPGGEDPTISSWLSAYLVSKGLITGGKVLGKGYQMGKGAFLGGKTLLGGFTTDATVTGLGGGAVGSGLLGWLSSLGVASTGGTMAAGAGAAALGAGVVGGGIASLASLVSGLTDAGKALNDYTEEEERKMLQKSAAYKLGGLGAGAAGGAAIGAGIGAFFGGVGAIPGAIIGGGIGGLAGIFAGNKTKKDFYAEQQAELEEQQRLEYERLIMAANLEAKYESIGKTTGSLTLKSAELRDMLSDTSVSADDFSQAFQKAVSDKTTSMFGKLSYTLEDIQELAKNVAGDYSLELGFAQMQKGATQAAESFEIYQKSLETIYGIEAKKNLGLELDTRDLEQFGEAVVDMSDNVVGYLNGMKDSVTMSLTNLFGDTDNSTLLSDKFIAGFDKIYDKAFELREKIQLRLTSEDVDIETDEIIRKYTDELNTIMEQVTNAQQRADLDTLKIKYSDTNGNMDAQSAMMYQQQLLENQAKYQDMAYESYNQAMFGAYATGMTGGNLAEYQSKAQQGLTEKIAEINENTQNAILEQLSQSTGVNPMILDKLANNAVKSGYSFETFSGMSDLQAADVMGFNKELVVREMDSTEQAAIAQYVRNYAATYASEFSKVDTAPLTQSADEMIVKSMENVGKNGNIGSTMDVLGLNPMKGVEESINAADIYGVSNAYNGKLQEGISSVDPASIYGNTTVGSDSMKALEESIALADENGVSQTLADKTAASIQNMPDKLNLEESGIGSAVDEQLAKNIEEADMQLYRTSIGEKYTSETMKALEDIEPERMKEANAKYATSLLENFSETVRENEDGAEVFKEELVNRYVKETGDAFENMAADKIHDANAKYVETLFKDLADTVKDDPDGMEEVKDTLAELYAAGVSEAIENADLTVIHSANEVFTSNVLEDLTKTITDCETNAGFDIPDKVSENIIAHMEQTHPGIDAMAADVESYAEAVLSAISIDATIPVHVHWDVQYDSLEISPPGGSGDMSVSTNANGGVINRPEISLIGEDGPEVIIPTSPERRDRGLSLLAKAAQMMGVAHADGAVVGSGASIPLESGSTSNSMNVNVTVNPSFEVSGGDGNSIVDSIKEHIGEIADELGSAMSEKLTECFGNMPA